MEKICTKCSETKILSMFNKDKKGKYGYSSQCRECRKKQNKEYCDSHKELQKEKAKKWYYDNHERARECRKEYYDIHKEALYIKNRENLEKNRDFYRTYMNNYIKERYHTDTHFKMKNILSARIRTLLKKRERSKRTIELLGCELGQFIDWIEYQFIGNMNWSNHGIIWHVDHVVPCNFFDLTNEYEQLKCFNWTNLQPLECKENISKGSKYDKIIIMDHQKKLEKYLKLRYQNED